MAEGDIHTDGHDLTDQGTYIKHRSLGTQSFPRDALLTLHNLWVPLTQMLQVAPGNKWCSACGDVRPYSYFDPETRDEDGNPLTYAKVCKQCSNAHDPKLRPMKYCSACRIEHPRDDFGDDEDYADGKYPSCYKSEARRKGAKRARNAWLNEGRELRHWQRA